MLSSRHLGLMPLLAVAALAACSPHVEGNGVYAEIVLDASQVAPFDHATIGLSGLKESAPLTASVFANDQPRQVVLSGDENVIQYLHVTVDSGGTLHTEMRGIDGYTAVHPPQVRIQAPELVGVTSIAGAAVTVLGAAAHGFAVTASARGQVTLSGAGGDALLVDLSGGALLDAAAYPVVSAELALTGGSRATVWPSGHVAGRAADASVVLVKGGLSCGEVVLASGATCGPLE